MKHLRPLFLLSMLVASVFTVQAQSLSEDFYNGSAFECNLFIYNKVSSHFKDGCVLWLQTPNSMPAVAGVHVAPNQKTLVIPDEYDGKPITEILFRYYDYITLGSPQWGTYDNTIHYKTRFGAFTRNCPIDADGNYVFAHQGNGSADDPLMGDPIALEEIVFPAYLQRIDMNTFKDELPSLKKIYFLQTEMETFYNLYNLPNLEEVHLSSDVPYSSSNVTKERCQNITLYVPEQYFGKYLNNEKYFSAFKAIKKDEESRLSFDNPHPAVYLEINGLRITYNTGLLSNITMNFNHHQKPKYTVYYDPELGVPHVTLNDVELADLSGELNLQEGSNILRVNFEYSVRSGLKVKSNGNGSHVVWMDSGKDILGNSGGSTVVKNVLAYKPYVMRVYYNSTNQRCTAKLNGHELSGTNYGNYTDYSFSQIHENDEVDVQVTDKPCRITVSKSEVYANLMATRMIDGQSYATFLSNEMQLTAGYGTKFSFVVPNTVALQTAKLGNNSASVITDSNGNKTYSFTVPQSENAYLTLVGTPVTSPQSDYSLQTVTKVGHGTVRYSTWYYDEDYVNHQTAGELMTPVSTIITPLGESEGECGWTLTITPDPGYELTTLFGSWDTNGSENGYSRPDVVNMLTEHAYIDNDTEEEYPGMDGPTAEQKLASGGNFSLDLDVDRTLSYNASTRTYTFNVDGIDWEGVSMSVTIGFSDPNETAQKQINVVTVGTPIDGLLSLEYKDSQGYHHESLTSAGSFSKSFLPEEVQDIYFIMDYEEGYEIQADGGVVTIPFTAYHNGEESTSSFEYDDGQIKAYLPFDQMVGTWTFVFPEEVKTHANAVANWSFVKVGEGLLNCQMVPLSASAESETRHVLGNSEIISIPSGQTEKTIISLQCTDGGSFRVYCNGEDRTSDFTAGANGLYTLTTLQADLKDAGWTVVFNKGSEANTFTYLLQQTSGGQVLVGVNSNEGQEEGASLDMQPIQDGSMTMNLSPSTAKGITLVVTPDDDMTVRIFQGDTDVTGQFTYIEESNSYVRETDALANESLQFVFANMTELGVVGFENIEFACAEVERICVENWDTSGDGKLSRAEAAAVTTLLKNGVSVFQNQTSITSFDEFQYFIGMTKIEMRAFNNCTSMKSIILPQSITSIEFAGFSQCRALTAIDLPEGLLSIGQAAFGNTAIKSLFIPKNVRDISFQIVSGCNNLVSLSVDPANTYYDSREGCNAVIRTSTNKLVDGYKLSVVPEGVKDFGFACFSGSDIESVVLPSTLLSLSYSFNCYNLKSVVSKAVNPPTMAHNDGIGNLNAACVLKVPVGSRNAYLNAGWTEDIFKGGVVEDISPYDTNNDDKVTVTDLMRMVNVILGVAQ